MKRMTSAAALLVLTAMIPLTADATHGPEARPGELLIFPAGIQQYTEYRVHTGRKAVLADGTYSDVYKMKKPARGNVFLDVNLNLATEGEFRLTQQTIRLVDTSRSGIKTYEPFDWFLDRGLTEDRAPVLTFTDKTALEALFEVPVRGLETLVLFIGDLRVGTVAEVMAQSPALP